MDERPTCGKGLADNAALLEKLGKVTEAVGDILDAHLPSLDLTDERSRKEHEVYRQLVEEHRRAGSQLEAIARQMAASRDLPMGRHKPEAMASPAVSRSFQRFVELEQDLATALQLRLEQDRRMLDGILAASHPRPSPADA
jgi:hypothetical protein